MELPGYPAPLRLGLGGDRLSTEGIFRGRALIDGNPSKTRDPDRIHPATVDETLDLLSESWARLCRCAGRTIPMGEAKISRLDLARDFAIESAPDRLVLALSGVPRTRVKRVHLYRNAKTTKFESLYIEPAKKAGLVRLYDKAAEQRAHHGLGDLPPTLRFEAECRRGWLADADLSHVADLSEAAIDQLAVGRWHWAQLGSVVATTNIIVDVVSGLQESDRVKSRLLGDLLRLSEGVVPEWAPNREADVRRFLKEHGLVIGPGFLSATRSESCSRLDFRLGQEVLISAASGGCAGAFAEGSSA